MPKQHPERYEPGELEKTRKNIGPLSDDDARDMAEKLGGEIGLERPEPDLDERYAEFKRKQRRRSDILPAEKINRDILQIIDDKTDPEPLPKRKDRRISHRNQVRMNFLAARNEHQIKTKLNAFLSFFSFLTSVRDMVNPRFITQGDRIFYYKIEQLVVATRNLLSRNRKNKIMPLKNPFYLRILETIKNWDIAGINAELSRLQKNPRHVLLVSTAQLTRKIYRPVFMLHELNITQHILPAYREIQDKSIKALAKDSPDIEKIESQFAAARDALYSVFEGLKELLFPLLMKHSTMEFNEYEDFILKDFTNICQFLNISADDIIQPEEEHFVPPPDERTAMKEPEPEKKPVDIGVQIGFTLLDEMFPEAGWKTLERRPDMLPYYADLLVLPRGMEILPPGEPLQYIIILIKIIQELLHGFRHIEMNILRLNDSMEINLASFLDEIIRDMHSFIDETMEKVYIPRLRDFCRQMERSPGFKHSDYGIKVQSTLLWMKRKLLLPFFQFNDKMYSKPSLPLSNPKLYEQISYAASVFSRILADLNKEEPQTIGNPLEKIDFEIEHTVSHRLLYTLTKNRKKHLNRNLVLYTTSIIMVLDYLVNNPLSPFYSQEEIILFRHDPDNIDIPEYSVQNINPLELWKKEEQAIKKEKDKTLQNTEKSILEGFLHRSEMQAYLKKQIDEYHSKGMLFTLLVTRLPVDHDLTAILGESTRELQDITFYSAPALYYILLPDTALEEAGHIIGRIMNRATAAGQQMPAVVSIEYHKTWGAERLMKIIKKCDDFLLGRNDTDVWLYNNLDDTIRRYNPGTVPVTDQD
ncbi:MAG: hypothetical protein JW874_10710 [Spirochaetales bacterium]|nr:hypothetical protein [Spirochaetales bacterium]